MTWKPTSEGLPTEGDAKPYSEVLVRQTTSGLRHYSVILRRPQNVNIDPHTDWMPIPPPPEEI